MLLCSVTDPATNLYGDLVLLRINHSGGAGMMRLFEQPLQLFGEVQQAGTNKRNQCISSSAITMKGKLYDFLFIIKFMYTACIK
jgi:hypothetical protein